jgi:hypothetical protein
MNCARRLASKNNEAFCHSTARGDFGFSSGMRPQTWGEYVLDRSYRCAPLLKPSETDDTDAIAAAYLYAAEGDPNAALTQAVSDAVVAIDRNQSPNPRQVRVQAG